MSQHTRTYDYEARLPDPATMRKLSGLEYLQGVLRGEQPAAPIPATLGYTLTELAHGSAVFEGSPERFTYNPLGSVHGGWAATILDSAMGCAVHTTLPVGKGYTTVDLSGHYAFNDLVRVGVNVANLMDNVHRETFGGDLLARRALAHVAKTRTPRVFRGPFALPLVAIVDPGPI